MTPEVARLRISFRIGLGGCGEILRLRRTSSEVKPEPEPENTTRLLDDQTSDAEN